MPIPNAGSPVACRRLCLVDVEDDRGASGGVRPTAARRRSPHVRPRVFRVALAAGGGPSRPCRHRRRQQVALSLRTRLGDGPGNGLRRTARRLCLSGGQPRPLTHPASTHSATPRTARAHHHGPGRSHRPGPWHHAGGRMPRTASARDVSRLFGRRDCRSRGTDPEAENQRSHGDSRKCARAAGCRTRFLGNSRDYTRRCHGVGTSPRGSPHTDGSGIRLAVRTRLGLPVRMSARLARIGWLRASGFRLRTVRSPMLHRPGEGVAAVSMWRRESLPAGCAVSMCSDGTSLQWAAACASAAAGGS